MPSPSEEPVIVTLMPSFFLGLAMSAITGAGGAATLSVDTEENVARFRGLSGTEYEVSVRVVK